MKKLGLIILLLAASSSLGCGTYKTTYMMRREEQRIAKPVYRRYAHGVGIGGNALLFTVVHRMFPALVAWTRPIDLSRDAPDGFYKIVQFHSSDQVLAGAIISDLLFINWYHPTNILITPAK